MIGVPMGIINRAPMSSRFLEIIGALAFYN
jgi:hypothetical protein